MRELSTAEVNEVSGAGYYRDLAVYYCSASAGFIGFGIGALVPFVAPITAGAGLCIGAVIGGAAGYVIGTILEGMLPPVLSIPA